MNATQTQPKMISSSQLLAKFRDIKEPTEESTREDRLVFALVNRAYSALSMFERKNRSIERCNHRIATEVAQCSPRVERPSLSILWLADAVETLKADEAARRAAHEDASAAIELLTTIGALDGNYIPDYTA